MYCKLRNYLTFVFPTTVTYLLLMATVDRCMSASSSTWLRSWSQLKVARIVVVLVLLMGMLACSHIFIFVDHYPSCSAQPGLYAVFYIAFLMVYGGLLPDLLLLVFGIGTMRNVSLSRARIAQGSGFTQQPQQIIRKTNSQFVVVSEC